MRPAEDAKQRKLKDLSKNIRIDKEKRVDLKILGGILPNTTLTKYCPA